MGLFHKKTDYCYFMIQSIAVLLLYYQYKRCIIDYVETFLLSLLCLILTNLAYRANAKKRVISNNNLIVLKALG